MSIVVIARSGPFNAASVSFNLETGYARTTGRAIRGSNRIIRYILVYDGKGAVSEVAGDARPWWVLPSGGLVPMTWKKLEKVQVKIQEWLEAGEPWRERLELLRSKAIARHTEGLERARLMEREARRRLLRQGAEAQRRELEERLRGQPYYEPPEDQLDEGEKLYLLSRGGSWARLIAARRRNPHYMGATGWEGDPRVKR